MFELLIWCRQYLQISLYAYKRSILNTICCYCLYWCITTYPEKAYGLYIYIIQSKSYLNLNSKLISGCHVHFSNWYMLHSNWCTLNYVNFFFFLLSKFTQKKHNKSFKFSSTKITRQTIQSMFNELITRIIMLSWRPISNLHKIREARTTFQCKW